MAIEPARLVLGPAWLYWRAPDGRVFNGMGPDLDSAIRDARDRWRGRPLPLPVDGDEYQRRLRNRRRRGR